MDREGHPSRRARDRCLIAADNGREVVRHYYSPTTGLHVGTALSINAEPGARADLAQLVAVDIPYLTISLSGVRFSIGHPVLYDGGES